MNDINFHPNVNEYNIDFYYSILTLKANFMKKNVGTIDLVIRLAIVALVVVLYFTNVISGIVGIVLMVVAGILLLTTIFRICPIYLALGISTRSKQ